MIDAVELEHDDQIRVGRQILRLILKADAPIKEGSRASVYAPAPELREETAVESPSGQPAQVTFAGAGVTFPIALTETILEVADEHDVELDYECWIGKCGCDLIRIVEGREFLNEVSDQESKTIKRRGARPGECRLACMTLVHGPVVVDVVE